MTCHVDGSCDQLDWIRREQFTYYLTIAYMVTAPTDWPAFRRAVYGGLEAALGLAPPPPTGPYPDPPAQPDPEPQRRAFALLGEIRDRFDPAVNWPGFAFALWDRRHDRRRRDPVEPRHTRPSRIAQPGHCGGYDHVGRPSVCGFFDGA